MKCSWKASFGASQIWSALAYNQGIFRSNGPGSPFWAYSLAEQDETVIMVDAGLANSTSENYRMIRQGAVKIDGERVDDRRQAASTVGDFVFQVGKRRVARISLG